jgi:class 3 adenylate cyclase
MAMHTLRPAGSMIITRARSPAVVQTLTVLFADLRGYTALAERLPAAGLVPLLNEYYDVLGAATLTNGGRVFHIAGDGMMAGFGVNGAGGDGAREAFAAAYTMLEQFTAVAARWRHELLIDAGIGIGLHLGEVALCVLGPARHRASTLVGDTVNVAARLCGRARAGEVLFSCTVAAALSAGAAAVGGALVGAPPGSRPFLQLPQFEWRGRRAPIDIWCMPAPHRLALEAPPQTARL